MLAASRSRLLATAVTVYKKEDVSVASSSHMVGLRVYFFLPFDVSDARSHGDNDSSAPDHQPLLLGWMAEMAG